MNTEKPRRHDHNTPRRIIAGNATRLDPDARLYPGFINLSLAQQDVVVGEEKAALQNQQNVTEAKKFVETNEK